MRRSALTLTLLASVAPMTAWAVDPTAPLPNDTRLRVVDYDPDQVTMVYVKVGQTTRIRIHPQERVVKGGLTHSDQVALDAETTEEPCGDNDSREECAKTGGTGTSDSLQSCNRNMCTSVVLNNIFILPRRELQPQSFFLRTEWCPEAGRCLPGEYAIELRTLPPPVQVADASGKATAPISQSFYGIQYRYTDRERAHRAQVEQEKRRAAADARREFNRNNPAPLPPSVPDATARWELANCSSGQEIVPDEAWTDGRTTFLRYKGTRRLPNVYERRGDRERTLIASVVEPDAWGNTIRVTKVLPILLLWDGDTASCVVNVSPDINGRTEMAVAPIRSPVAGQPRPRR